MSKCYCFLYVLCDCRYHYYGIGIRETSQYYHSVYTGKGLTRWEIYMPTCLLIIVCFDLYQSISISYPCKRFVQSETKFCFLLHKNSARKMARKFFFCAATLNGLGGPGHFKTIFISLKKELCKKEKCKFLTLKNSGFLVLFFFFYQKLVLDLQKIIFKIFRWIWVISLSPNSCLLYWVQFNNTLRYLCVTEVIKVLKIQNLNFIFSMKTIIFKKYKSYYSCPSAI